MNEQSPQRTLTRSRSDRYIGGVAAGIARHLKVDPGFVRTAFIASLVFGGAGLLAYVVLLALVPVEGDPAAPLSPVEPKRRNRMIALAVITGAFAILLAGSGDFAIWAFGFWPGTVFGILLWTAAAVALAGLLSITRIRFGAGPAGTRSGSASESGERPAAETATYAESPTQIPARTIGAVRPAGDPGGSGERPATGITEVMETRQMGTVDPPGDEPRRSRPEAAAERPAPAASTDSGGPALVGRIMLWVAIGFAGLFLFSSLFVVSAGVTAIFGGVPMAAVVILLGAGMVIAGLRGRRALSLWLLTAAVAATLPMAVVSLADLRVEGGYGDLNETPLTAADIPADGYRMAAGNMTIDLRKLDFARHRSVELPVRSGMGLTSVIVPDRVCVANRITGAVGLIDVRGRQISGIDISREFAPPQGPAPQLRLDAGFKLGALEVIDATAWRDRGSLERRADRGAGPGEWTPADRSAARKRSDGACRPGIGPGRPGHRKGSVD